MKNFILYYIKYILILFDFNFFLQKDIKDQYLFFKKNKKQNFKNIIDIGANVGLWSIAFKTVFSKANFYLIEPNSNHNKFLRYISRNIYNYVLFSKKGMVNFYYTEHFNGTGNSIYKENSKIPFRKYKVKSTTLDYLLYRKFKNENIDLIKIDTQGSELDILKGSKKILRNTKNIIIEISETNYNYKKDLKSKIFKFLQQSKFKQIKKISVSGYGKTKHSDYLFTK